jgi:hypothetical protein
VEVNVNWLPPLLEPIALNPKVITTPIIDKFRYDTFEYRKLDDGGRGCFNWDLQYRRFPRRPEDIRPDAPIPTPLMVLNYSKSFLNHFYWHFLLSIFRSDPFLQLIGNFSGILEHTTSN